MTRHRPARRLLARLAVLALLGGCGLSENGEPQAIAPENLPPGLLDPNPVSSTTLPQSPGTTTVAVYFLMRDGDGERLVKVEREVANATEPGDRIGALFSQPTSTEAEEGLTTRIPADTVLVDVPVVDDEANELVVDLSNEFTSSIEGEELAKAFAQIVYTVTAIDGVRQVRFLVDGKEIRAPDAEGVEKEGAVTRADYAALAPR